MEFYITAQIQKKKDRLIRILGIVLCVFMVIAAIPAIRSYQFYQILNVMYGYQDLLLFLGWLSGFFSFCIAILFIVRQAKPSKPVFSLILFLSAILAMVAVIYEILRIISLSSVDFIPSLSYYYAYLLLFAYVAEAAGYIGCGVFFLIKRKKPLLPCAFSGTVIFFKLFWAIFIYITSISNAVVSKEVDYYFYSITMEQLVCAFAAVLLWSFLIPYCIYHTEKGTQMLRKRVLKNGPPNATTLLRYLETQRQKGKITEDFYTQQRTEILNRI